MTGIGTSNPAERMMAGAGEAITLELVDRTLAAGVLWHIIVSTNYFCLAAELAGTPVQVVMDPPGVMSHFGRWLQHIVDRFGIEKFFYMGDGDRGSAAARPGCSSQGGSYSAR